MRTVVRLTGPAILIVALATRAAPQVCPDVTGCWSGDYTGAVSGTVELAVQQTGDQLSGIATVHDASFGTLSGFLSGTATCETIEITSFLSIATVDFSGQVTDDCMAGTFLVPVISATGTWQACRISCCGNGVIQLAETCDDGNAVAGDGCSDTCMVEPGFSCVGQPSVCTALVCGNGLIQPGEECDDGNMDSGDGCSDACAVEPGFTCFGEPSLCIPIVCGNGVIQPGEECDDGNTDLGDCCRPDCTLDPEGTECMTPVLPGTCDASGNCVAIPTLSEWGVGLLSLLMLAAVLRRRPAPLGIGVHQSSGRGVAHRRR